ncbi:MAG: hypothetical protein IPO95_00935 [Rhodanobacteraceae bacterium]|nr:hypothetical protein [Rhodanobacteraceae bacterium]
MIALPNNIGSVFGSGCRMSGSGSTRNRSARFAKADNLSGGIVAAMALTTTKRRCAMPSRASQASTSRWLASATDCSAA